MSRTNSKAELQAEPLEDKTRLLWKMTLCVLPTELQVQHPTMQLHGRSSPHPVLGEAVGKVLQAGTEKQRRGK